MTDQKVTDAHLRRVGRDSNDTDPQVPSDAQPIAGVGVEPSGAHPIGETQSVSGSGSMSNPDGSHGVRDAQPHDADRRGLTYSVILYADILDDLEHVRAANEARHKRLITDKGYPEHGPEAVVLRMLLDDIQQLEKGGIRNLERAMEALEPLGPWVLQTKGLGSKTVGRFLGAIGGLDRFPSVSQLRSYCGLGVESTSHCPTGAHGDRAGVAPRPRKGQKLNYNPIARSRIYVVAERAMMRKDYPYYVQVYAPAKEKYADALHGTDCSGHMGVVKTPTGQVVRRLYCKGSGSDGRAVAGDPLSPGHIHSRAKRIVMKVIVKDMWLVWNGKDPTVT